METPSHNVKQQHYVWRSYLEPWAEGGEFYCYRKSDKMLFPTLPKAIAKKNYFYQTEELSDGDLAFLDLIVSRSDDERLRRLNQNYITATQQTFRVRKLLEAESVSGKQLVELERLLKWTERNLVEQYHTGVEHKSVDLIKALRSRNLDFYSDDSRCIDFLHFLTLQYFRTANMKAKMSEVLTMIPGHDPRRTSAALCYIGAINLGASLYVERNKYRLRLIENETSVPLIVGDQPVLNMLDPATTDDVELYFPVSPRRAVVLTKRLEKFPEAETTALLEEVRQYNQAIYGASADQVYSNDVGYLQGLVGDQERSD